MKQLTKISLLMITTLSVQNSKAGQPASVENQTSQSAYYRYQQDTAFYSNYIAASKEVFVYSKPNLTSKTKIKFPQNVALSVTKKSGDFVYGKFNVSSNKSFKGWFRLVDLKEILFTAPKIN